jgi:hypothetical protein
MKLILPLFLVLSAAQTAFKVFPKQSNWEDAQKSCQEWGGNLASVNSKKDLRGIRRVTKRFERK